MSLARPSAPGTLGPFLFLAACSLLAAAGTPAHARAQPASAAGETAGNESPEDARTLFQRGQVAYSQGDYEDAIELWTRAYGLDPRPLLQWNLSQAFERLGRLEDAAAALETYLANADPADEHQADARARLGSIRERIAATGVTFRGAPEGATVLIDGADSGRLPRPDPVRVSVGSHRIVVRADGYADFTATIVVPAGQTVDVEVEMAAARAAEGGGGGELPVVPIILFAAGGAALVAGAIMGGVALGQAESAPTRVGPEADGARTLAAAADITMGVGVACGVVGLVILLTSGGGSGGEASASAALEVVPFGDATSAGLVASGAF